MKVARVTAIPLEASFASTFGGSENVPAHLLAPASHFRRVQRTGQMATLVLVESDNGVVGYGGAFGLPRPLAATALIKHVAAPCRLGMNIDEPGTMLADLVRYFEAQGNTR